MNGVIAVRSLLVADTGLTSLVPVARIAAGMLPQGTDLSAISLMSVSGVDRRLLRTTGASSALRATVRSMRSSDRKVSPGFTAQVLVFLGGQLGQALLHVVDAVDLPDLGDRDRRGGAHQIGDRTAHADLRGNFRLRYVARPRWRCGRATHCSKACQSLRRDESGKPPPAAGMPCVAGGGCCRLARRLGNPGRARCMPMLGT